MQAATYSDDSSSSDSENDNEASSVPPVVPSVSVTPVSTATPATPVSSAMPMSPATPGSPATPMPPATPMSHSYLLPEGASGTGEGKQRKYSQDRRRKQPKFGICFDIDGVLARGTVPIAAAQAGMKNLLDNSGKFRFPVAFVTNALNTNQDKANQLSAWFGVTITKDQMIQSPSPLEVFDKFHDKFCVVVGQGKMFEIVKELGFTKLCTIEEIASARPLLDVVDHDNRRRITEAGTIKNVEFPKVEAILLLGEPKRWESSLQILTDLLMTDGEPDRQPIADPGKHLPVIACNMDLRFMERAHIPRFGHGAFLVCLEALYKKITGSDLQYTALVGKPSEITFRFAEHVLAREALKLGFKDPIKTMYLIGDNPESDISGSNLYQRHIDRMRHRRRRISFVQHAQVRGDPELPDSRNVPLGTNFSPQTVEKVEAILVCTGIYQKGSDPEGDGTNKHGHRDFPTNTEFNQPTFICDDAQAAIDYILTKEGQPVIPE